MAAAARGLQKNDTIMTQRLVVVVLVVALLAPGAGAGAGGAASLDASPPTLQQRLKSPSAPSSTSTRKITDEEVAYPLWPEDARFDGDGGGGGTAPIVITNCTGPELGGFGDFSQPNRTCVLPPNVTATLKPGTWLMGEGSLRLQRGSHLRCTQPGCLVTVVLGGALTVHPDARLSAGFINVTAAVVEILGPGASIDAAGTSVHPIPTVDPSRICFDPRLTNRRLGCIQFLPSI